MGEADDKPSVRRAGAPPAAEFVPARARKVAVYVGTTAGPVRIARLRRYPRSIATEFKSTTLLIVSSDYAEFVLQVVHRIASLRGVEFRIEFAAVRDDDAINLSGKSWQLGVFLAHALEVDGRFAALGEAFDEVLWCTGAVDPDELTLSAKQVGPKLSHPVQHEQMEAHAAAGVPVRVLVPQASKIEAEALVQGTEWGGLVVGARDVREAAHALGIALPAIEELHVAGRGAAPPAQKVQRPRGRILVFASVAVVAIMAAAGAAYTLYGTEPSVVPSPQHADEAPAPAVAEAPAGAGIGVQLWEWRAPAGTRCALVHEQRVAADLVPVALQGDGTATSRIGGASTLCAVELVVSNADAPRFVQADIERVPGLIAVCPTKPPVLSAVAPLTGQARWRCDLVVSAQSGSYRLTLVSGAEPPRDPNAWLPARTAPDALRAQGLQVQSLVHRLTP